MRKYFYLLVIMCILSSCNDASKTFLLVGTYTDKGSNGFYVLTLDDDKKVYSVKQEIPLYNPSYLAVSKDNRFIYAITEGDSLSSKFVSYSFAPETGEICVIDSVLVGSGPCFIEIDALNELGITANYGAGSFSYFPINSDGSLGISTEVKFHGSSIDSVRQTQPHVHTAKISPNQKYVYFTDLGTDKIYKYNIFRNSDDKISVDTTSFKEFKMPEGAGPRHLTFHPMIDVLYLITELSGDVIVFDVDNNGDLKEKQIIKADEFDGFGSADIQITPNGKYLYTSHRLKNDGISIFSVDEKSGKLTKIGYQPTDAHPRNFLVTADGKKLLVANRDSDNIEIFEIQSDGLLTNKTVIHGISMPVCVKMIEGGSN